MKLLPLLLLVVGCGYSSVNNDAAGQVKQVHTVTPLFCSDYVEVALSLGVVRNGTGSISKEDIVLALEPGDPLIPTAKAAATSGALVQFRYDEKRWPAGLCWPTKRLTDLRPEVP